MNEKTTFQTKLRRLLAVGSLLLLAAFMLTNLKVVEIWFFGITASMPIAFVVLGSAVLGGIAGYALRAYQRRGDHSSHEE